MTSTSEVYGKLGAEKFHEESDLVLGSTSRPRWCYACSKIIDEFLAKAYCHEKDLPVVVTRLFNTIGPRQTGQYGMVVPRFVRSALTGEPITVYGDGRQQRSFTWVGDVVKALIELVGHPDAVGQVVNVGHTKEISILALAELVKERTGSSSEVVFIPYEEAYDEGFEDMPRRLPDLSRIRELIGYEPSIDLTEMLERIIESHREELANGR
jgi:UDP-glucose 4-epimerase